VGTDPESIKAAVVTLLTDKQEYDRMSFAHNPYGDGTACQRIVNIIKSIKSPDVET
jgi:UDP-N-acetylglucosamine 2-epimerase (non-hydrolysing)